MDSDKSLQQHDAITKFASDITQSLDTKDSTMVVYLDLSKAFDTLNHKILLKNLNFTEYVVYH